MPARARIAGVGLPAVITRCEPAFDVDGAYFPAWLLCMVAGGVLSIVVYRVFVRVGIEPHLGPPALVYPSLYVLSTLLVWIAFYRT
ncbi:hypothetical protein GPROT1_02571 [Gammaproteobacteria bacterium]|jgi:hypothetical protein|nr:hypothetical protein GPROT1_02571 [Gammaproteobacteria bacterium]